MNHVEHYHDWLRDAHAMEKQAESMLESMASRIDNYPDLRARIEQHVNETKHQITVLEEILDRNDISRSVIKDSMSKMAALGQSIGGMFPPTKLLKAPSAATFLSSLKLPATPLCWLRPNKRAIPPPFLPLSPFWKKSARWLTGCSSIFHRRRNSSCCAPMRTVLKRKK